MTKTFLGSVIGLLVSVGTITAIYLVMDVEQLSQALTSTHLGLFIASIAAAIVAQILRAWRVSRAVGIPFDFKLTGIVARHQFWANLLPFRTGELVLPLYLKTHYRIKFHHGASILVILRIYDLMMILMLGGFAAYLVLSDMSAYAAFQYLFLVTGLGGGIGLFALPVLAHILTTRVTKLPEKFLIYLQELKALNLSVLGSMVVSSVLIWAFIFLAYALAFFATGAALSILQIMTSGAAGALAFALPINGIAGIGPFEAAIASILPHFGVAEAIALSAGICAHLTTFLGTASQALFSSVLDPFLAPKPGMSSLEN